MNRCCLCNSEFSANFKGASLAPDLKDARLCLKCAHAVRILTKFDAKDQDTYEENFYYLHKKLIINTTKNISKSSQIQKVRIDSSFWCWQPHPLPCCLCISSPKPTTLQLFWTLPSLSPKNNIGIFPHILECIYWHILCYLGIYSG